MTTTLKLIAHVDENHRLTADVPPTVAPGSVEIQIVVPVPQEDEAGAMWAEGVAREWAEDWSDPREDIYTSEDGEPSQ